MKISEIKNQDLRLLAMARATQYANGRGEIVKDLLCDAFVWDATPERVDFWAGVLDGDITELKKETPLEIANETIDILQKTLDSKDKSLKISEDIIEVLEGRIRQLTEFNNSLINML